MGEAVVDAVEESDKPVKVRADRQRGIPDDGTVRLVTIRGQQASVRRSLDLTAWDLVQPRVYGPWPAGLPSATSPCTSAAERLSRNTGRASVSGYPNPLNPPTR